MSEVKRVVIRVKYRSEDGISKTADEKILKIIKDVGGIWYAQGLDRTNGERDICFDLEI